MKFLSLTTLLVVFSTLIAHCAAVCSSVEDTCNYNTGEGAFCAGTCSSRENSVCGMVTSTDTVTCSCIYCNLNPATQRCEGVCRDRELVKCLNKIAVPRSNADCGCASCTLNQSTGQCTGDCFQSGLTCQLIQLTNMIGEPYNECTCN